MNLDWDSLKEKAANISLYDIKAGVRKVQNMAMNYTEMEAKVREATNNEPWGASSTTMQEIANGTYNYQLLNEIMPMIYKRFTEKAAEEWRQIYKALQLLEFLIKNGSERVIDDARSHLTLLKMLRQFHFIDQNGKDQGINVRNRAKELADLLGDVERIRAERKKSRTTRTKYTGVEGGAGIGGSSSMTSGNRYGGFGSEEHGSGGGGAGYGAYSGGVYGDGGGFGGQESDFQDTGRGSSSRADKFEEYDEDEDSSHPTQRKAAAAAGGSSRRTERVAAKKPTEPKKKEPEVDLFSFDEPISNSATPSGIAAPESTDDDDFDDFQSATPSQPGPASTFAPPPAASALPAANISSLSALSSLSPTPHSTTTSSTYSALSPPPFAQHSTRTTPYQPTGPNYFTSIQAPGPTPSTQQIKPTASNTTTANKSATTATGKSTSADAFGSLWSTASVGVKKTSAPTQGRALGQLAKEKSAAGIWGASVVSGSGSGNASGGTISGGATTTTVGQYGAVNGGDGSVTAKTGKEPKWMDDLLG